MPISSARLAEGLPHHLRRHLGRLGVNFALFSAHATPVELWLFDAKGERELERIDVLDRIGVAIRSSFDLDGASVEVRA